jgi:hypothetical protein
MENFSGGVPIGFLFPLEIYKKSEYIALQVLKETGIIKNLDIKDFKSHEEIYEDEIQLQCLLSESEDAIFFIATDNYLKMREEGRISSLRPIIANKIKEKLNIKDS